MNKSPKLWAILCLIFVVIFNIGFFVLVGSDNPASVWISYGFIHFAYLMLLATSLMIQGGSSAAVFGFSLYWISAMYFLVELMVGIVFIYQRSESYEISLVVQVVLAGLYGILLVAHLIANKRTAESVERHEAEVAYIRDATLRVKALMGKAQDKKAGKAIEKVYDLLHASPTKTAPSVHDLEFIILGYITDLENAVLTGDVNSIIGESEKVIAVVEERNRKLMQS